MIIHLSDDLMLVGKVSSWAKSNNVSYQNARTVHEVIECVNQNLSENQVIVDLQLRGLDVEGLPQQLRQIMPGVKIVGYAQHVMVDLITAANENGFDAVWTRGQFDRQYSQLLMS